MKMTRLISLSLAILIFGSNFGYALNIHYCGGKYRKFLLHLTLKIVGWKPKRKWVPSKKELSKNLVVKITH